MLEHIKTVGTHHDRNILTIDAAMLDNFTNLEILKKAKILLIEESLEYC